MKNWKKFPILLFCLGSASCSVRPLQEDVTHIKTIDIVKHIRCEAREGVRNQISELLLSSGYLKNENSNQSIVVTNYIIRSIADFFVEMNGVFVASEIRGRLQHKMEILRVIFSQNGIVLPEKKSPETEKLIETFVYFAFQGISYGFQFDITENNDFKTDMPNFNWPFYGAGISLGFDISDKKIRQNKREFTISESFAQFSTSDCKGYGKKDLKEVNHHFPISGSIGLEEVFDTYFDLSLQFGIDASFVDTITYTTTFNASVSPKITIDAAPGGPSGFRLAQAGGSLSATRKDIHQVIISLTPPTLAPKSDKKGPATKIGKRFTLKNLTSSGLQTILPDSYSLNAAAKHAQFYVNVELDNQRRVTRDELDRALGR